MKVSDVSDTPGETDEGASATVNEDPDEVCNTLICPLLLLQVSGVVTAATNFNVCTFPQPPSKRKKLYCVL